MKKFLTALVLVLSFSTATITVTAAPANEARDSYNAVKAKADSLQRVAEQLEEIADSIEDAAEDVTEKVEVAEDNSHVSVPFSLNMDDMQDIGTNELLVVIICVLAVFIAPIVLIGVILYFVFSSRRQRYRLMEKAIESGQPLPQELYQTGLMGDEVMKNKGIKNVCLGIGLIAFFNILGMGALAAIGVLVLCYGAGQIIIACLTKKKEQSADTLEQPADKDFEQTGSVFDNE